MKKTHKITRINRITATLITITVVLSFLLSVLEFVNNDFSSYDNLARIVTTEQREAIEKGSYEKGKFPYLVLDLEGRVLYCDKIFEMKKGELINVDEILQIDKNFQVKYPNSTKKFFTLKEETKVKGFLVFILPTTILEQKSKMEMMTECFAPLGIGLFIAFVLMLVRTIYCNQRILKPLREISDSAQGIIRGNYDLEVVRTYGKNIGENEVGDLTYSFELMRDELKEKQVREEELKKSQQELISCISHDLKTPIATIKAYSEGIRDGIATTEVAKKEYIKIIIAKTDLLIEMIVDLLEYSNAQLNQLNIRKKEVYFLEYFSKVMKELDIYVKQQNGKMVYHANMSEMIVNIDEKRIMQVIYNVVENSIKYADKHAEINIVVTRLEEGVLIVVKDNGIGLSADDIPYVFDKFYRAEKSRSSRIPGSGLGLSICKYIIEQHNGEIYCRSLKGKGCEIGFTIY